MCGYESPAAALMAPLSDFFARVQTFDADGSALAEAELPGPLAARGHVVPERLVRLLLRASGCERWLAVKATPILDRRGAVRMSISIFRDVSRERMVEAEHERIVRGLETEKRRLELLVDRLRTPAGLADAPESSDR
jgi:PAS domain-containing protein